ncbi:MAG: ABC transporter permease [Planctomycetota bacterium]|nr:ABC transporter permease [Planctomycetota bacterium]
MTLCTFLSENFLTWRNLSNVSRQISITTIIAMGETILIIAGMIDLAAGAVLALAGVLSVAFYKAYEPSLGFYQAIAVALAIGVLAGVVCNSLSGLVVVRFKTPPFIATLAMQTAARGAVLYYCNGQNIYQIGNYNVLGQGYELSWIPVPVLAALAALFAFWLMRGIVGELFSAGDGSGAHIGIAVLTALFILLVEVAVNGIPHRDYPVSGAAGLVGLILAVAAVFWGAVRIAVKTCPEAKNTRTRAAYAAFAAIMAAYAGYRYFLDWRGKKFDGVPTPVIFMLVIAAMTWYILRHTRFGRYLYAVGGNEEAARASGVNISRTKFVAYMVSGIFVGLAGVLYMSRNNAGLPNAGAGYEFEGMTAAIIGGTSFSGGIGTAMGTLAGGFIMGFLNNGMNLLEIPSYPQQIVRGAIIVLAVIWDVKSKQSRYSSHAPAEKPGAAQS